MLKKYDFKQIESETLDFWEKHQDKIKSAISDENPDNKERFSFLEGPPTANAPPGLHHVEARVFKDVFTRFKTLQGYKVSRKGGWDCHGLPVEVQVEKKLGLASKKDVVKYGVKPFIDHCKQDIFTYVKDWSDMTKRLAYWVDLEKPYMTLNTNYMESVWWALKEIANKDLLYKGYKIVPYCSRCATPLSSHEVAQGYKDVKEKSVVVKLKSKDHNKLLQTDKEVFFLAWTTTPWTLPSNLALAFHPKEEYVFIERDNEVFVVAEKLMSKHFSEKNDDEEDVSEIKVLKTVYGSELESLTYEPLFDYFKDSDDAKNSFRIISADYVTTEDGTGIVHQAPAFGEDDFNECKKNNIGFVNPVDDNGEFTEEVSDFTGRFVKDTDGDIIKKLKEQNSLFKVINYEHSYPFCWRCSTPLIYFAKDTWFIKVSDEKVKKKMLELNETVNWSPSNIKDGRFGKWLEGARDWALSRNKFWGTPLPVWVSEDDPTYYEVIGSIAELEEKTGVKVDDLHIDTVDALTYTTGKGLMRRSEEVIDCWFDSGSAPFAQYHYPFENKDLFESVYPYGYISEAIDQTRGWFYTMMVINSILFEKAPYKSVAVAGLLSDENGEKMSKSKGNVIKPMETFDQYGVDSVRIAMSLYPLGTSIKYGPSVFKEQITPFFITLWNSYMYMKNYFMQYNLDGTEVHAVTELVDEWLLSKTNSLIHTVTQKMESHQFNHAITSIMDFVTNVLSKTYIKLIRERTSKPDNELAFALRYACKHITKLLSPFAPYITEYMYQDFFKDEEWSIHFSAWSKVSQRNESLEVDFDVAQNIIQGILASRDKAKLGVRWPVSEVHILTSEIVSLPESIIALIKAQTNVKEVIFVDSFNVSYDFALDYKKLGLEFGTQTGDVIPAIQKNFDMVKSTLNQADTVVVDKWTLSKDHFKVTKIVPEPYIMAPFPGGEVYLNTTSTPQLLAEGYARELTRRIQQLRKDVGLEKVDQIKLFIDGPSDLMQQINIEQYFEKVGVVSVGDVDETTSIKIKSIEFTLGIKKVD